MAYYTGAANNFGDLQTALLTACTANGWTLADGILSKGLAFVRPYISSTLTITEGPGLLIEGGTGKSGSTLSGAAAIKPRLGVPGASVLYAPIVWPATYHLLVFTDPVEVYLVLNFNVMYHYWLAFGVSNTPGLSGTGLWLSGSTSRGYRTSPAASNGFAITPTSGRYGFSMDSVPANISAAPFWSTESGAGDNAHPDTIHTGLDGTGWSTGADGREQGSFNAILAAGPLVGRSPSRWNSDSPLIPIKGYLGRPSSKFSLVLDLQNARYIRLDTYEPGDLITLGEDRWKVFPFYLKNSGLPDGGQGIAHTGTFGWAIRYTGP